MAEKKTTVKKTVKVPVIPQGKASGDNNWDQFVSMAESEADKRFALAIKDYPDLPTRAGQIELAATHAARWYPISRRVRQLAEALDNLLGSERDSMLFTGLVLRQYGLSGQAALDMGVVALCFLGAPYQGATALVSALAKRRGTKHHKGSWPATASSGGNSSSRDATLDDILGEGF